MNFGEKVKAAHRPRKQTRDKFKAAVTEILQANEGKLELAHDELQAEARKSPYVRKLLQGYLESEFDGQLVGGESPFLTPGLTSGPEIQRSSRDLPTSDDFGLTPSQMKQMKLVSPTTAIPATSCNDSSCGSVPQVSVAALGLLMAPVLELPSGRSSGPKSEISVKRPTGIPTAFPVGPVSPLQQIPPPPPLHAPPRGPPNLICSEPHSPAFGPPDKPPGSQIDQVEVLNLLLSR